MSITLDRPWKRPGAVAYARKRIRAALWPPVTVEPAPAGVVQEKDAAVTMRDGVVLRVNLYRPAGDGPFPVLMSAHPYSKDALPKKTRRGWTFPGQYRIMNQSAPVSFSELTSWEAPDPAWWAARGYAVINADTRGAGHSGGTGDLLSDEEAQDYYELIEWAAAQPWSSGSVGLLGVSYLALSQYKVAALSPPHLRAICPWEGFTDIYQDFCTPGGIVEDGFARIWLFQTQRIVRTHTNLRAERHNHPLRDAWWQSITPDLASIRVPVLECTSFSDDRLHSVGSMRAFEEAGSVDRFAYNHRGPKWASFYSDEAKAAQLAFFDRYLRGQDVPKPPRLRLEVRDSREHVVEVRDENEWPLARTRWQSLHLGHDGSLNRMPDPAGEVSFDLRRGAAAFTLVFDEDTELSGPMTVRLWASFTGTDDPSLFVGVEKWSNGRFVPFEGSYGYGRARVASGQLRVALRALDTEHSTSHHPVHSFTTREPVTAGEPVEVQIALSSSSTLFRAGESLRLMIGGRYLEPRNPFFGHFPAHYVPSPHGTATIHWGPTAQSALEVPVIPAMRDA
jgi:predicted acyl esterase